MRKVKTSVVLVLLALLLGLYSSGNRVIDTYSTLYHEGNTNYVLNKILSDNELKSEIPNMFNYASNGNLSQPLRSGPATNDPNYALKGLYSNKDEDGTTYYYRGNVDNNIIQFGAYDENYYIYEYNGDYFQSLETCQLYNFDCSEATKIKLASQGEKMYWKIVRVNGDGSLRLLYNGTSPIEQCYDNMASYLIGRTWYNDNSYSTEYTRVERTGYTYGDGIDSYVKKEVDTWYSNTLGKQSIYDDLVIEGRFCSDSSGYQTLGSYGFEDVGEIDHVFASYNRLTQEETGFAKNNAPTFICPETTEDFGGSYRLKAGLITADELAFAGEAYGVDNDDYSSSVCDEYFTMTPVGVFSADPDTPEVWRGGTEFRNAQIDFTFGIRPVINVDTNNKTLVGDGTVDNHYELEEITTNRYRKTITVEEGSQFDITTVFEEESNLCYDISWSIQDETIARIENNKIVVLQEGTTIITGTCENGLVTYEIELIVINNPITNSMSYILIGIVFIVIIGTITYIVYKKKNQKR